MFTEARPEVRTQLLHARVSIERSAPLQAEYWITAVRDETLALACLRLGLPAAYAKGSDRLPAEVTRPVQPLLAMTARQGGRC